MRLAVQAMLSCDLSKVTRSPVRENFNSDFQPLPSDHKKGLLLHTLPYHYNNLWSYRRHPAAKPIETPASHFTNN